MFMLYTPQDANKVLPEIRQMFANIVAQKNRAVALQQELTLITERGAKFEPFVKKKQELNTVVSELHKAIEQLERRGVVIKSVDEGLLDFPSKRFDEEVWLCWKSGETEIKFWHAKDEGFTGRKPLETTGIIEP
jgi:hypothetical protein